MVKKEALGFKLVAIVIAVIAVIGQLVVKMVKKEALDYSVVTTVTTVTIVNQYFVEVFRTSMIRAEFTVAIVLIGLQAYLELTQTFLN